MNFGIKEIPEVAGKRFAESPLGRMSEGKVFDKPMSEYDKPLRSYEKILSLVPNKDGHWDGESGNSKWFPNRDYIPPPLNEGGYNNPDKKKWGDILDKYNVDGIPFKDGEPDFSEISKGTVEIEGFSTDRASNFAKADIELAKQKGCSPEDVKKWRQENGYTWHECKDMKTMQLVPHEVHANVRHSGGISEAKKH